MFLNLKIYKEDSEVTLNTDLIYCVEGRIDPDGDVKFTEVRTNGRSYHVENDYSDIKFILTGSLDYFTDRLEYAKDNE